MSAPNSQQDASTAGQSPACKCSYWRRVAVDALLELAWGREQVGQIDEDKVELLASRFLAWDRLLGGQEWSPGRARAEARACLTT